MLQYNHGTMMSPAPQQWLFFWGWLPRSDAVCHQQADQLSFSYSDIASGSSKSNHITSVILCVL